MVQTGRLWAAVLSPPPTLATAVAHTDALQLRVSVHASHIPLDVDADERSLRVQSCREQGCAPREAWGEGASTPAPADGTLVQRTRLSSVLGRLHAGRASSLHDPEGT